MTVEERERIEAELAAITPGHWVAGLDIQDGDYWALHEVNAFDQVPVPDADISDEVAIGRVTQWADAHSIGTIVETHNYFPIPSEQHDANQRFIARAPERARRLIAVLAERDRLETELDEVRAQNDRLKGTIRRINASLAVEKDGEEYDDSEGEGA